MACKCGKVYGTQRSANELVGKNVKRSFFVRTHKADGTRNAIDLVADAINGVIPASYIEDRINAGTTGSALDITERWLPVTWSEVIPAPAEFQTQTRQNGANRKVGKTLASFVAQIDDVSKKYLKALGNVGCGFWSVYEIDSCANLIGVNSKDSNLFYPKDIEKGTYDTRDLPAIQGTQVEALEVSFQYSDLLDASDISIIESCNIEEDLLTTEGLMDVCVEVSNETNAGFTITQTQIYGNAIDRNKIVGWVVGDYTLVDSGGIPIVITSVTETSAGVYDFVIPVAGPDTVTLSGSKTGFEFPNTVIVLPA